MIINLIGFCFSLSGYAVDESFLLSVLDSKIMPFIQQQTVQKTLNRPTHKLNYLIYDVQKPKGVIVISPGRIEALIKYSELIYDLKDLGFSIYAIDHYGQGFSDRLLPDSQKGHIESYKQYYDDFTAFMNEIVFAPNKNFEKVYIIAHSMGANIATQYAKNHSNKLAGLVLSSPMYQVRTDKFSVPVATFITGFLVGIWQGDRYAMGNGPGRGPYNPEDTFDKTPFTRSEARFMMNKILNNRFPQINMGGPTNRWVFETLKADKKIGEGVENIDVPVVILQAGDDLVVIPEAQNNICEKMPHCRVTRYEGSYHEILMERDSIRNQVMEEIKSMMK